VIIPERQQELNAFCRKYFADEPKAERNGYDGNHRAHLPTDNEVLRKFLEEKTDKGRALFAGDKGDYDSHSEADQALVNKLFYYTQDKDQIDRLFRRSGLMRDKWQREDYRRKTYLKAKSLITEVYDWDKHYYSANSANRGTMTAAELMAKEFKPARFVIDGLLPEGVTLLAGKPKKGKSWMALGMCEAVAVGGVAFGTIRVGQGDTLYLALEDNTRRLQGRLRKVLDGRDAPEKMHLHTEWVRLDEGGADELDEWLEEHPDCRLVVIDTLAKIRKPARGQNVYAEDYAALQQLLPLAARHGVAIVVVTHLRKIAAADPMDEINASMGLTAGVDGFMILRRMPGSKGPTLYVDGRDIEEPTEYALHWNHNTATWTIEGDAEEVHVSKERADILLVLNRSPEAMTPKEVADIMPGAKYNNIKYLMWTMLGDGQLIKDDNGRYSSARPTNPRTNPKNAQKIRYLWGKRGLG